MRAIAYVIFQRQIMVTGFGGRQAGAYQRRPS